MPKSQTKKAAHRWKSGAVKAIKAGEYEKAITALSHALEKEPDNSLLYFSRAIAFSKLKDLQKTKDDLEKAASLGNEKAIHYLAQFN
jgi:Tfp pilus assembly protein PilF